MKNKIAKFLPNHNITSHSLQELFIADYKRINNGDVVLLEKAPTNIKFVYIQNANKVAVCFDGFKDNALPLNIKIGLHNRQCECVIFPESCNNDDWVLFIETKYANDRLAAFKETNGYPNSMVMQIIETVKYFRDNNIIDQNKKVHAIVSFPNLVEEFNSTIFQGELSTIDILKNHRILIRGTNNASIISEKRIKLN